MTQELLLWYFKNKRDLPWRKTHDPYRIWVSEIILQQTQIKTGIRYYKIFLKKFPNIKSLANANDIDVLNIWQGLGYYNRALNMLTSAKIVIKYHNGIFPSKYSDLIKLKGVGEYTAAAISSISAGEKKAVLDGNVYRFLSRLYDISIPINTSKGKTTFQNIANKLIPNKESGTYNQAIMEFGSIQCKKYHPKCNTCPLRFKCKAFKLGTINIRPVKNISSIAKTRYFNYLLIQYNDKLLIQQRNNQDIWKKLYEMPLIESTHKLTESQIKKHKYLKFFKFNSIKKRCSVNHKLSHQNLNIIFWDLDSEKIHYNSKFTIINIQDLDKYPFPKPLKKYFDKEHLSI